MLPARVLRFEVAGHERALWHHAEALLPSTGIEAYTQGLMDLGATLCSTRVPQCAACPLKTLCVAQREGAPERRGSDAETCRLGAEERRSSTATRSPLTWHKG